MKYSGMAAARVVRASVARGGAVAALAAGLAGCGAPSTSDAPGSPAATLPAQNPDSVKAALTAPPADATSTEGTPAAGADTATPKKPVTQPLGKPKAALSPTRSVTVAAVTSPAAPVAAVAAPVLNPTPAGPATRTQVGRVLDEAGQPLVGATVLLKGSSKGTSTDGEGNYAIEVPSGEATFLIGYGGYTDEIATTRTSQPLTVTLLPDPSSQARLRQHP